jgi:hypothetical protein
LELYVETLLTPRVGNWMNEKIREYISEEALLCNCKKATKM